MADLEFTTVELASEVWKPVPEYESFYSVSTLGRIRGEAESRNRTWKVGRILRPRPNPQGYLTILLQFTDKRKGFMVHRLVASAFIGPRPPRHDVNHLDGNKANNRASNLEYCTRKQNMEHARAIGLHDPTTKKVYYGDEHHARRLRERMARGEGHGGAKLNEADVLLIRERCSTGETQRSVAASFGIDRTTVSDIVRRKSWVHI